MAERPETRKEKERNRRKEEILSVALALFSKRGFKNVSMAEIADAAEYAVGTLYNLFDSKDAMFEELYEDRSFQIREAFLSILEGPGNEKERLSLFFRSQPDYLEQHGEFVKVYVAEMGQHDDKLSKSGKRYEVRSIITAALARLIEDGIKKRLFRSVDPQIAAKAIIALLETLIFESDITLNEKEVKSTFQKVEALFLEGLLAPRENQK